MVWVSSGQHLRLVLGNRAILIFLPFLAKENRELEKRSVAKSRTYCIKTIYTHIIATDMESHYKSLKLHSFNKLILFFCRKPQFKLCLRRSLVIFGDPILTL